MTAKNEPQTMPSTRRAATASALNAIDDGAEIKAFRYRPDLNNLYGRRGVY